MHSPYSGPPRSAICACALAALSLGPTATETAAQTASATVTFEVREIDEISLSGDPDPLVVSRSSEGAIMSAVDAGTAWSVTTNQTGRKVTALLDSDLPPGITLHVRLDPPTGGTSRGSVPLATTARDLIVDFGSVRAADLGITYTLSATAEAGVLSRTSRVVTFTIVTGI